VKNDISEMQAKFFAVANTFYALPEESELHNSRATGDVLYNNSQVDTLLYVGN
jgi:hypothetical protein